MNNRALRTTLAAFSGLLMALGLLWLGSASTALANGTTRYVATTGKDAGNDCSSYSEPCSTIQHAIDQAIDDDQILIAGGTYTNAGTVADITETLTLRGAYDPSFSGTYPQLHPTVLDAQGISSVVEIYLAGDVQLEYLTITNGDGTGNWGGSSGVGGGINAQYSDLVLNHCVISNNVASRQDAGSGGGIFSYFVNTTISNSQVVSNAGSADPLTAYTSEAGGIYANGGTLTVFNSHFLDNVGCIGEYGDGGGMYLNSLGHVDIVSNVIKGNKASTYYDNIANGGGLYISNSSSVRLEGNRIQNNCANPAKSGSGGGLYISNSEVQVSGNRIISNSTGTVDEARPGGGVYISSQEPVTLSNNLIAANDADVYGGGVCVSRSISPAGHTLLVNNTVADNGKTGIIGQDYMSLTLTNNLIAGHVKGLGVILPVTGSFAADHNLFWNTVNPIVGSNAVISDPLFFTAYGDGYQLTNDSPALNAGLSIAWLTDDLDGEPRPQEGAYDIGAYEGAWGGISLPLVLRNH
jgi:hypothetical protein